MKRTLTIMLAVAVAAFAAACSKSEETTAPKTNTANAAPSSTSNTSTAASTSAATSEDVPASVRAAFPDAPSITKQHKDITPAQSAAIEKASDGKLPDTDHHSYLAFSTTGGARKQIDAATVIEANGKPMVVVYESRDGLPFIREVRGEGVPQPFLDQFKGKGHDDKFQIGQDLKTQGADDATAKAAASAIRIDIMTMQTLYGSAHAH